MEQRFLMASDVGQILNRSAATIRFYERSGRLPAIRTVNGTRLFRLSDVERLRTELEGVNAEEVSSAETAEKRRRQSRLTRLFEKPVAAS